VTRIGVVGGDRVRIGEAIDLAVEKAADVFFTSIEKKMGA